MAQHRRVEPRGIIGTGMATDADKIRDIEHEQEKRVRTWHDAPERGFGDVLAEAPAKGELEDDDDEDPRKRKKRAPTNDAPSDAAMSSAAMTPASTPAPVV